MVAVNSLARRGLRLTSNPASHREGEVFLVREQPTGVERAAKLFYPQRNPGDRTANLYARKLHTLRNCPIAIQYHTRETITYRGIPLTLLVSEFVEGELLSSFLARQPGKRLTPFQGTPPLACTFRRCRVYSQNEGVSRRLAHRKYNRASLRTGI